MTVSYACRITNISRLLDGTIRYYRDAVRYIASVIMPFYKQLSDMEGDFAQHARQLEIESWIHSTDKNAARFPEFDRRFYKFPSYYRRAAILDAYGIVDSYKKLTAIWEDGGRIGRRPRLAINQAKMPCFYRGNTYKDFLNDPSHIFSENEDVWNLKLWAGHDWVWVPVSLRTSDVRYLCEASDGRKLSAPVLEKQGRHYALRYSFTYAADEKFVPDRKVTRVLSCDLGVNTDAVCSVICKDGTVAGRCFIDAPEEKDRLYTDLRVIRKSQSHGNRKNPRLWRFVNHFNDAVEIHTARGIVSMAEEYHCPVIVFEHLGNMGKVHGTKAQRITLWRKRAIQERVEAMAARKGIRVSYICAKHTSQLAFDGSGKVVRDEHNHALCTFTTGKRYNCDLSASYNIGARYFIRVFEKTMSARAWLSARAKVPGLDKRTTCTLSTLISLYAESVACAA